TSSSQKGIRNMVGSSGGPPARTQPKGEEWKTKSIAWRPAFAAANKRGNPSPADDKAREGRSDTHKDSVQLAGATAGGGSDAQPAFAAGNVDEGARALGDFRGVARESGLQVGDDVRDVAFAVAAFENFTGRRIEFDQAF